MVAVLFSEDNVCRARSLPHVSSVVLTVVGVWRVSVLGRGQVLPHNRIIVQSYNHVIRVYQVLKDIYIYIFCVLLFAFCKEVCRYCSSGLSYIFWWDFFFFFLCMEGHSGRGKALSVDVVLTESTLTACEAMGIAAGDAG